MWNMIHQLLYIYYPKIINVHIKGKGPLWILFTIWEINLLTKLIDIYALTYPKHLATQIDKTLAGSLREGSPDWTYKMIKIWHINNFLRGWRNNQLSKLIGGNIGGFRGSPLSAQVFIIYDDNVLGEYKKKYPKQKNQKITNNIKRK